MRILLFGGSGQVGWELHRSLAVLGDVVAPSSRDVDPSGRFEHPQELAATVRRVKPAVVVNAAAFTSVDLAERDTDRVMLTNAYAPGALAKAAAGVGALLVHYSTDYVYDGEGSRPWRETDPLNPINAYGRSKAEGDRAIARSAARHLIFRTSWVYSARRSNFLRTVLTLASDRDELRVVNDQWGAPTGAELIADVTGHVVRQCLAGAAGGGVYHLAAGGEASWHGYACFALQEARRLGLETRLQPEAIRAIPSSEYATKARRPANSRLDTSRLRSEFGVVLPDWRVGVRRCISEILGR
jgi:dTDP-4-dehydrorhamnose reductase